MRTLVTFLPLVSFLLVASPAAAQPADTGWPRVIETERGRITIYQPQVETLEGDDLEARAAVSVR